MHGDHRVNRLKLHELQVLLAVAQAGSMAKAAATGQSSRHPVDVRFGSKADMGEGATDVRFTPKSGHSSVQL